MKFTKILFVIVFVLVTPALAQEEKLASRTTTLADVAMPSKTVIESFNECVKLTGLVKTCERLAKEESKRSRKVAESASRADRPQVFYGGGYGYGTYNTGGGYRQSSTIRQIGGGNYATYRFTPPSTPAPAPGPPGVK